ncbi:hypothetical protein M3Y14_33025 (plasmid) [Bacillus thuringiensis]|uniref:hypothetical protein n=1 Tax=Bacillus thuringiensis TaxID=1428 RepID=UPI002225A6AE|nr:hypothetical protein [Bacillus thuringiensis]UYX55844.1 hypothetical protein M3Y14_33025 [Bacillus thuringiensis]
MNYKDTVNMLILDLMYLCEFVNSSNATSVNRMRNLVKEIKIINQEKGIRWQFDVDIKILEFINEYRKRPLPTFYDSREEIQKIVKYAHSDSFLKYLQLNIMYPAMLSQEQIEDIKNILIYLKKSTELGEECTRLLKELPKFTNDK